MPGRNSRSNYWSRYIGSRKASRRRFLSVAGATGAGTAGWALVGCGGDDDDDDASGSDSNGGNGGNGGGSTPEDGQSEDPTATPSGGPPSGGSLVTLVSSDPTSLDPHFGQGGGDHQFFWTIHDNLVDYNQAGELDASLSLAESWELADDTTINFKLREGVQFHDGTPFNADAVKFNVERAQSPESAAQSQMSPIQTVEVISDTEVRFVLNAPNAALLTLLGDRGGAMLSPSAVEEKGDQFGRAPVGTGKFVFEEWAQSDHILVSKNADYWGTDSDGNSLPYLDEIRWNVVPDPTVQTANLESGDADVIILSSNDVERMRNDDRFQVQRSATGSGWAGVYANHALSPIDDVRVRRAIGRVINKEAIIEAATQGLAEKGIGPIAVGTWAFNPDLQGLDFDLEEARKELDASGYPDGVQIEMITINTSSYEQRAELWKQMATEIGIDLQVRPVAVAELTQSFFVDGAVPMLLAGFSLRADPDGTISETLRSDGFYNAGHRDNAELDNLIDQARQTYDQEERKALYDEVQQIAIDEVYDWFIYYGYNFAAGQQGIRFLDRLFGGEAKPRWANLAKA